MTYQPRYVAYCAAHGNTPEQQIAADRKAWPGGCMAGFILWISEQWRAWAAERGGMPDMLTEEHYNSFDTRLASRFGK